jgi:hypothetical protein
VVHTILAAWTLVAMIGAAVIGTGRVFVHPVDSENPSAGLVALQNARAFQVLTYRHKTLWLSSTVFWGVPRAVGIT